MKARGNKGMALMEMIVSVVITVPVVALAGATLLRMMRINHTIEQRTLVDVNLAQAIQQIKRMGRSSIECSRQPVDGESALQCDTFSSIGTPMTVRFVLEPDPQQEPPQKRLRYDTSGTPPTVWVQEAVYSHIKSFRFCLGTEMANPLPPGVIDCALPPYELRDQMGSNAARRPYYASFELRGEPLVVNDAQEYDPSIQGAFFGRNNQPDTLPPVSPDQVVFQLIKGG